MQTSHSTRTVTGATSRRTCVGRPCGLKAMGTSAIRGLSVAAVQRPRRQGTAPMAVARPSAPVFAAEVVSAPQPPKKIDPSQALTIGIVGFGLFGQFLAKRMVQAGHRVLATSRSDYHDVAREMGVEYFQSQDDFCEQHPEVVILVTSILSTNDVLSNLPIMRLKRNTLIVDVLSVKVFPKQLMLQKLPKDLDILCTHPMFGQNSGGGSWAGLNFQYEKVRISPGREERVEKFLNFFRNEGCNMVEMSCEDHDQAAASTQFVTHTVGRMLGTLKLQPTSIDTKGFEALLNLVRQTNSDSFDLYYGLFLYNQNATEELERLEKGLESVKDRLFSQLHEIARKEMFPKAMLEKMLSKGGAKVLKLFFRGLARYGGVNLASTTGSMYASGTSMDTPHEVALHSDHPREVIPLYLEILTLWRDRALAAAKPGAIKPGSEDAPHVDKNHVATFTHAAKPALDIFREAFHFVDIDNSGNLSPGEMAARVLKLTDTRATPAELNQMVKMADMDGDGQIGFRELLLFCSYEFFSSGAAEEGSIDLLSLQASLNFLGLPPDWARTDELNIMLAYANAKNRSAVDVSVKGFASVFGDINNVTAEV